MTWVDLEPVTRAQCAIVTEPPSSSPPMSLHVTINVGSSSDLCNVYMCGFGGFLFHPGVNAIPWPDLLSQPDVPPPPLPPLIKGQVGRLRFGIDILQLFPHHYSTPAKPASSSTLYLWNGGEKIGPASEKSRSSLKLGGDCNYGDISHTSLSSHSWS